MSDSLLRLFEVAAACVAETSADCAVIGGCARNAYARPRATEDLDLALMADADTLARMVESLSRRGFQLIKAHRDDPADPVPDIAHFEGDGELRIDVLFAKTPFEKEAVARRVGGMEFGGHPLSVVTPEDLIVFKLIAGRSQDIPDARAVVRARALAGAPLDWSYIERWCREWEVLDRLESLRLEFDQNRAPG